MTDVNCRREGERKDCLFQENLFDSLKSWWSPILFTRLVLQNLLWSFNGFCFENLSLSSWSCRGKKNVRLICLSLPGMCLPPDFAFSTTISILSCHVAPLADFFYSHIPLVLIPKHFQSLSSKSNNTTTDGRKKIEDMYHPTVERSEFYTMADVLKPAVLFTPSEELEKVCLKQNEIMKQGMKLFLDNNLFLFSFSLFIPFSSSVTANQCRRD